MLRVSRTRLGRVAVTTLAMVAGGLGVAIPTLAGDRADTAAPQATTQVAAGATTTSGGSGTCLIVDTDLGLDDYRAIAALLPSRSVRAFVVTEGISGVQNGAMALSMFLASRGQTQPVIPGLASATPPPYDWLPAAREGAERLDNYFAATVPFGRSSDKMIRDLDAALYGCNRVDVLALGPWTSFVRYAYELGSNVNVVASGRPFVENNPDNFNCEYDIASCRTAAGLLRYARSAVFVDLPPAGDTLTYDPTLEMVQRFNRTGMPGLLRTALQVDTTQWLGSTRLWDDAATLYMLVPSAYARRGQHVEPIVSETTFRNLLVNAINAS
jgi:hypothetical protein